VDRRDGMSALPFPGRTTGGPPRTTPARSRASTCPRQRWRYTARPASPPPVRSTAESSRERVTGSPGRLVIPARR